MSTSANSTASLSCGAEVDIQRLEDVRRNWPFWRDRRVDAYAPITQRFLV